MNFECDRFPRPFYCTKYMIMQLNGRVWVYATFSSFNDHVSGRADSSCDSSSLLRDRICPVRHLIAAKMEHYARCIAKCLDMILTTQSSLLFYLFPCHLCTLCWCNKIQAKANLAPPVRRCLLLYPMPCAALHPDTTVYTTLRFIIHDPSAESIRRRTLPDK